MTGVVGFCRGNPTPYEMNVIAWGGVMAQAGLYLIALARADASARLGA